MRLTDGQINRQKGDNRIRCELIIDKKMKEKLMSRRNTRNSHRGCESIPVGENDQSLLGTTCGTAKFSCYSAKVTDRLAAT